METEHTKSLKLWAKLQEGNLESLGVLYDIYIDELFLYGLQFSKDKNVVMDSIHDLFLNLYKFQNCVEEGIIANEWEVERSQKLKLALKALSKRQRKGLKLRFTENNSYEEIAERMNVSVPSSRTIIYRAIKTLRKEMQYFILVYLIFSLFF